MDLNTKLSKAGSHRLEYVDVARGIAMLCIIAGHMDNQTVARVVFTFHVPIFFILSGYFYREGKLKQTIFKLLKPYVFTTLCVLFVEVLKVAAKMILGSGYDGPGILEIIASRGIAFLYASGSRHDFLSFMLPSNGAIWFLIALAWVEAIFALLMWLTRNWGDRKKLCFLYAGSIILWLVGYFTAKVTWLPFSIQSAFSAMLFMVMGYHLHRQKVMEKLSANAPLLVICAVIWGVSIYFSITNDHMSLVRSAFPNPIINIAGACAGTWIVFEISRLISRYKVTSFLKTIGQYSLVAMSFHAIESIFPWGGVQRLIPGIGGIVVFFLKIACSLCAIWLVRKIKPLRWIYSIKQ